MDERKEITGFDMNLVKTFNDLIILWGGLMVSALDSGASAPGFEPWPETLCRVLGQDTSLSRCLSPPRFINGYRRI